MAWKLRKDKLKADTPDAETPEDGTGTPQAAIATPPPPEVTADAPDEPQFVEDARPMFPSRPAPAFSDEAPSVTPEPDATDDPQFSDEPQFVEAPAIAMGNDEPISLGAQGPLSVGAPDSEPMPELEPIPEPEPIALGAFTPYQPPEPVAPPAPEPDEPAFEEPSFDAPRHDPVALAPPPPVEEPETPAMDAIAAPPPAEEAPAPAFDLDRESLAPGLVTTDTESGLPRVAPFVLDTPAPEMTAPAAHAMPSVVLRLGNLSATYFLVKDVTTIGRPDSAVQNYPDIEVELDDGVSRRHAEIRRQGDAFSLVDVGSTNGTILNGEMLAPDQSRPLSAGDRIRIGERTEILFE